MPENNQFSFPTTLPRQENRLPTFPQIPYNPYTPIQKTAFANTTYDPSLEADFGRLNLSTPSRNSQGLGFDRSFLRNLSDSSLNTGFPHNSGSQLDYTDLNLQRMRVESAVRGQTGLYMDPHGFSDSGEELFDGFGLTGLNPGSLSYVHYNNGLGYGLNRWNNRVNQDGFYEVGGYGQGAPSNPSRNGFSSVYSAGYGAPTGSNNRNGFPSACDMGYGAPANTSSRNVFSSAYETGYGAPSNANSRNGFQSVYGTGYGAPANSNRNSFQPAYEASRNGSRADNGFRRRGRSGTGSVADKSGGSRSPSANGNNHLGSLSERLSEMPFEQWRGNIVFLAKDQHGYAFLKKKIEEKNKEEIELIFLEVKDHVRELMVDQYGNYPIQKIFEVCDQDQMTQMLLLVVSEEHYLMSICVDTHGTRAMQKMLEHLTAPEQVSLAMSVISRIALVLTKSMSGYRVIERCLKSFTNEQNRVPQFTEKIMAQLAGSYVSLSMNKYGSNVVERCIRDSNEEQAARIIREIYDSPNFLMVLQDPFGNYVTQTALEIAKGGLRHTILTLIQHHHPYLHSHPHGKRVLAKTRGNGKHHRGYEYRRVESVCVFPMLKLSSVVG
ncbi:hypothetical protein RHSIM_Rhsim05G0089100 [Rhododendron simsii]|uniref:PUM-HD domain-containing protein n=1 Tax=Rhododendron simsii TaxID=118357 RepID=A0A834LQ12_RHOSS|nr:hypothetical protein RHSIM_Rhsim05G0089100 [Rhododendron simsii]